MDTRTDTVIFHDCENHVVDDIDNDECICDKAYITEISCILNQLEDQIGFYDEKLKLLESALSSVLRESQEGCASNPGTASCELGVRLDGFRSEIQHYNDKLDILINRIML